VRVLEQGTIDDEALQRAATRTREDAPEVRHRPRLSKGIEREADPVGVGRAPAARFFAFLVDQDSWPHSSDSHADHSDARLHAEGERRSIGVSRILFPAERLPAFRTRVAGTLRRQPEACRRDRHGRRVHEDGVDNYQHIGVDVVGTLERLVDGGQRVRVTCPRFSVQSL